MLRWVVYEFPLDNHPNAVPAAIAGRCAGDQDRFWQMRDLLFARQQEWYAESSPNRTFEGYADQLGLDRKQFATCLSDREHLAEIMSAKKYGESLGVNSTPTLFMNGQPIPLTRRSYEALEEQIKALVAQAAAAEEGTAESAPADAGS
jgi:protein-disulfide isomerase